MLALLAQAADAAAAPAGQQPPPSLLGQFALPALLFLFFVVVWLPMLRRQKREAAQTLASVKPGAKVVLSSGIVGTVVTAKDGEDELTVRSADARVRVLRSSVARVVGTDDAEGKA